MTYSTLGSRMKSLREQLGLTKAEVMKTLSIHNLSRFECNERIPGADILLTFSRFFNVSIDWLLTGKEVSSQKVALASLELTPEEAHFIELLRQLSERDRIKIQGMIELKLIECKNISSPNLSACVIRTADEATT